MIEDMEAEVTELSEINSKTDNLVVTEEADGDEAIPNLSSKGTKNTSISEHNEHWYWKYQHIWKRNKVDTK